MLLADTKPPPPKKLINLNPKYHAYVLAEKASVRVGGSVLTGYIPQRDARNV
jgi:hypothetical protein